MTSRDPRCRLLIVQSTVLPRYVSARVPGDADITLREYLTRAGFQAGDVVELRLLAQSVVVEVGDDEPPVTP